MLKPGQSQWSAVLKASMPHHDSLEGLLRAPLVLSATFDVNTYGTPKRGCLVYKDGTSNLFVPIVLAEVGSVTTGNTYNVTWWVNKFNTSWTILAVKNDGTTSAVTATAYSMVQVDENTGLKTGTDTITFSAALPANTVAIILSSASTAALEGVVYESTDNHDFPLAVEVVGAKPSEVAGGNTKYVQTLSGVKQKQGLLFIRTI